MAGHVIDIKPDCLTLEFQAGEAARLNGWLDRQGKRLHVDDAPLADLKVCVNEAFANILTHNPRPVSDIEIRMWRDGRGISIEIIDSGTPFDPTHFKDREPASDLEHETIGGWGVSLMKKLTDAITYRHQDGRNRVVFFKNA